MKGRNLVLAAVFGAAFAAAATAAAGQPAAEGRALAAQLMQNCDAHKFETVVKAVVDGESRQSKAKLCGKHGQSDADWVGTLKDAIAKLETNEEMALAVREQIKAAISAEIARLESGAAATVQEQQQADAASTLRPRPQASRSINDDYASLPPLPTTPPPPPRVLERVAAPSIGAKRSTGDALPLLGPAVPPPKLSFACFTPGEIGGDAPCTGFERETVLTIRAGEDLRRGLELRFARNGVARASVELAQLRRGKSMRVPMPADVCRGAGDGRLDLQLVEGGFVISSDGPYSLRC